MCVSFLFCPYSKHDACYKVGVPCIFVLTLQVFLYFLPCVSLWTRPCGYKDTQSTGCERHFVTHLCPSFRNITLSFFPAWKDESHPSTCKLYHALECNLLHSLNYVFSSRLLRHHRRMPTSQKSILNVEEVIPSLQ